MFAASRFEGGFGELAPDQLRAVLTSFLPQGSTEERVRAVESGLRSPFGESMREAMARWIVDEIVPVDRLVPPAYVKWRPPVRDAMMFVVARLSPARLAPKLVEQLELPGNTSAEKRLLLLIVKVPGLQKLGQVIARNQHLRPALRNALARLENGIRDVKPEQISAIIEKELGRRRIEKYEIKIASTILSEASVSAVVRFSWQEPGSTQRQRGVFKVLKPHIPEYFAEDMDYLQGLAQYFGDRHHRYGFPADLIPDTFKKVRRLLQHEVNFAREQRTLIEAACLYRGIKQVRVPQLIHALCTPRVTALSEEYGAKITNAAARLSTDRRRHIAEQLVEALVAVPLLTPQEKAVFHGDPHAGNLLYNSRTGELIIIDWALRERLTREQRRHMALLFLMVSLRDAAGATAEVLALSHPPIRSNSRRGQRVRETVAAFIDELPVQYFPGGVDAMELLERVAVQGVKFPGALVMLSKVLFTLNGILGDITKNGTGMGFAIARRVAQSWIMRRSAFRSPLKTEDWLNLQCSALLYASRMWLKYEQALLNRYLPPPDITQLSEAHPPPPE